MKSDKITKKEEKKYYEVSGEERLKMGKEFAKRTEIKERFYLWDWCMPYGWRQMGNSSGYETEEELKRDHSYKHNLKEGDPQRIMKAQILFNEKSEAQK